MTLKIAGVFLIALSIALFALSIIVGNPNGMFLFTTLMGWVVYENGIIIHENRKINKP